MRSSKSKRHNGYISFDGLKKQKLQRPEMDFLDGTINHELNRLPAQPINTACRNFYKGCSCVGCHLADNYGPANWPKVGGK